MSKTNLRRLLGYGAAAGLLAGLSWSACGGSGSDDARTSGGSTTTTTGGSDGGSTGTGSTTSSGTTASDTTAGGTTGGPMCGASSGGDGVCQDDAAAGSTDMLYNGSTTAPNCGTQLPMPRNGYWFHYDDSTGTMPTIKAECGGCAGDSDCAIHAMGMGFTDYGAGIGFDLSDDASQTAQPYDASSHTGIQFYAKGTITGTRKSGYVQADQTIHLKLVIPDPPAPDGGVMSRSGDDFGFYCKIQTDTWTLCKLDFASATRDGFNDDQVPTATDMFDPSKLLKVQFEFSRYTPSSDAEPPNPVNFDVWIDNVSFY